MIFIFTLFAIGMKAFRNNQKSTEQHDWRSEGNPISDIKNLPRRITFFKKFRYSGKI